MDKDNKVIRQFSISDIELFKDDDDVDFAHVKLWALAEGGNSHKNPIDFEVLERDANTILGKFIIGKFSAFTNDTTTHVPDQKILGYVNPDQTVVFEEKDGKKFITVDGVLSKLYATEIVQMFKENQNQRYVSCEFSCLEGDEQEDGNVPILKYNIHGITILGLNYLPSCEGAEIKVMKFAKKFDSEENEDKKENKEETMAKTKTFTLDIENLWSLVYTKLEEKYPDSDYGSIYRIDGIYKSGEEMFVVIRRKEESQKYKLPLTLDNDEVNLGEEMVSVEETYVETGDVKTFSVEGDEKYKEFLKTETKKDIVMEEEKTEEMSEESEKECVKDEKEEDTKEMEEVEDKGEEKKEEKEEKKFSLDAYADTTAIYGMLVKETEQAQALAKQVLTQMSAQEIVLEFVKISNEVKELKEFKNELELKDRRDKFFSIIAPAKEKLTVEMFAELYEEGVKMSLKELDGFDNKVKSFVAEHGVKEEEEETISKFGAPDEIQNEKPKNVFERIKQK